MDVKLQSLTAGLVMLLLTPSLSASITVDSNNCLESDVETVFPIVSNPQIRYYLFTSANLLVGEEIKDQNVCSLQGSKFDKKLPTKIVINGWRGRPEECQAALIKDAYLNYGNFNLIIVDWTDWNLRDYFSTLFSIRDVGSLIGNFTKFLNANGVSFNDIYLIGFGFGAHLAGAAGQSIAPYKYNTIYGLDPTGPGFENLLPNNRLDPSDAQYVEVILTDIFVWGYGAIPPIGHSQYYPNNGRRNQPFCPNNLSVTNVCSHTIAVNYFANTFEQRYCGIPTTWDNVVSLKVPNATCTCPVLMGGEPSIPKQGLFYVNIPGPQPSP